jgi:hypothetical protein
VYVIPNPLKLNVCPENSCSLHPLNANVGLEGVTVTDGVIVAVTVGVGVTPSKYISPSIPQSGQLAIGV